MAFLSSAELFFSLMKTEVVLKSFCSSCTSVPFWSLMKTEVVLKLMVDWLYWRNVKGLMKTEVVLKWVDPDYSYYPLEV